MIYGSQAPQELTVEHTDFFHFDSETALFAPSATDMQKDLEGLRAPPAVVTAAMERLRASGALTPEDEKDTPCAMSVP